LDSSSCALFSSTLKDFSNLPFDEELLIGLPEKGETVEHSHKSFASANNTVQLIGGGGGEFFGPEASELEAGDGA
jgi:hypothetical protein